jgi:hypothetical protein
MRIGEPAGLPHHVDVRTRVENVQLTGPNTVAFPFTGHRTLQLHRTRIADPSNLAGQRRPYGATAATERTGPAPTRGRPPADANQGGRPRQRSERTTTSRAGQRGPRLRGDTGAPQQPPQERGQVHSATGHTPASDRSPGLIGRLGPGRHCGG